MPEMTQGDYFREVQSIAETILEEALEYALPDATEDQLRETLEEGLWETIDSHQWVIYTAYNFDILRHSPNDGYTISEWGSSGIVQEYGLDWARLAFGALYADVSEVLWRLFEEREPEPEPMPPLPKVHWSRDPGRRA